MKEAWANCHTMTLFAMKHAHITAVKMFFQTRNLKILTWLMKYDVTVVSIAVNSAPATFKLHKNKIRDMKGILHKTKNHTHWRRCGTTHNFFLSFINKLKNIKLEKQIIIKKTVEVDQ